MEILKQLLGWQRGKARKGAISALALKMEVSYSTIRDWLHGGKMSVASMAFVEALWDSGAPLELKPIGRPFGVKDGKPRKRKFAKSERIV